MCIIIGKVDLDFGECQPFEDVVMMDGQWVVV